MNPPVREDLERFRTVIASRLGLHFDDGKLDELGAVLRRRLKARGQSSTEAYLAGLAAGAREREELRTLCSQLTVPETYFFRAAEHFRAFTDVAVPELQRVRNGRRPLRILSAGCASGEEAYSAAMVLRERFPGLPASDISVLGIDFNPVILAAARKAHYTAWSLRETTPDLRDKYFLVEEKQFVPVSGIRSMVVFEERNLCMDDGVPWTPEPFDVIFCRNVIMYLVPDAARKAVALLTRVLAPGGFLFLSHVETLRGISRDFPLRHTDDAFFYQKREDDAERAEPTEIVESSPAVEITGDSWVDAVHCASEHIRSPSRDRAAQPASQSARPTSEGTNPRLFMQLSWTLELLRQEGFREALETVRGLPADSAADRDVQLLRAVLLTNCGEVPEAEAICRQLLAEDNLNAGARYLAALCREHLGDPAGAMEQDRAAIYLDPTFAMPHLHLGLLTKRSGNLPTARREMEQAAALLPREDGSRILLLGGGFSRKALLDFSLAELQVCGGSR
jgi:chemotaxis protein methyltransferase CheR